MTEGARVVDAAVMDALPQPVWTARLDGSVDYANQAWHAYTGFAPEASLGTGWAAAVHPHDVPVIEERFQVASAAEEPYEVEHRFRRADGAYRWHLARVAPLRHPEGGIRGWVGTATDIDERKRAEETTARLAAIVESSWNAIIGRDLDGTITSWNPGAEALFGYAAEEIVGQPITRLLPPGQQDELADLGRLFKLGEPIPPLETVRLRKDGSLVEVVIAVSPIHDRDGRVVGGSAIYRDCSEEAAARVERRERERQAELVAAVGTAMTARLPLADQLRRCTEAIVTHLGAAFARVWTLDDEDDGTLVLRASAGLYTHLDGHHGRIPVGRWKIGRIAAERRPHLTNTVVGDPEVSDQVWAEREGMVAFAGYPLLVGERLLGVLALFAQHPLDEFALVALGSVADVLAVGIDRTRAEVAREALLTREQAARTAAEAGQRRLAFLAEASAALAASLDYEATLKTVAGLAVPILGAWCVVYVREEDGTIRRLALAAADPSREKLAEEIRQRFALNPDAAQGVPRVIRTGQSERLTEGAPEVLAADVDDPVAMARLLVDRGISSWMCVPLTARGRTFGALAFVADEGRQHTSDDLALAEDLAQRAALAIDNARLYSEAQEAVAARDRFLSIAAHELRTPITVVKGMADLLLRPPRGRGTDPEHRGRLLQRLAESANRLARLTDDLLDVSRLRLERLPLRLAPVDLGELARTVAARYADRLERRGAPTVTAAEGCVIVADRDRMEQVLTNLLDNALKYSPHGGQIEVAVEPEGEGVRVTVRDQGIGLPAGTAETIFEPFGRAANATVLQLPGLGLGLYLGRELVERHGGRIWAESAGEGQGTTLSVWLPWGEGRLGPASEGATSSARGS